VWGIRRWLIFGLTAAAPFAATLLGLVIVIFVYNILESFGVSVFDDDAPDSRPRLLCSAVVILAIVADAFLLILTVFRRKIRRFFESHSGPILDILSCNALVAIGLAFAVFDMALGISERKKLVLIALTLGLVAAWPLFLGRGRGVRHLLLATAIYGAFAGWIAVQRQIDWNMRRPFLRAYAQIRPGMTREQVEALMRREFRGKRPVARWDDSGGQYTLDPDDGRFNAEFLTIYMNEGRVVSADYLPD
jgi:hypothetical protein